MSQMTIEDQACLRRTLDRHNRTIKEAIFATPGAADRITTALLLLAEEWRRLRDAGEPEPHLELDWSPLLALHLQVGPQ